jgi:hypothetical protein
VYVNVREQWKENASVEQNINTGIDKLFEPIKQILFMVGAVLSPMGYCVPWWWILWLSQIWLSVKMEPILGSLIEGICHWNIFPWKRIKYGYIVQHRWTLNMQIVSITKGVKQHQLPCAYVSTTVGLPSQDSNAMRVAWNKVVGGCPKNNEN